MGGVNSGVITTIELWEYDPSSDSWTNKSGITSQWGPTRSDGVAFSINGKGYYGYGYYFPTGGIEDLYEYDPSMDSWSKIFEEAPPYTNNDKIIRAGATFVLDSTAYYGLGIQDGGYTGKQMHKFWVTYPDYVGVNEYKENAVSSLYPNPSKGLIYFETSGEMISYSVFDISGKEIKNCVLNGSKRIDLDELLAGMYFIKLTDADQGTVTKKISIVK